MWSSSEVQEMAAALMGFVPPAEVARADTRKSGHAAADDGMHSARPGGEGNGPRLPALCRPMAMNSIWYIRRARRILSSPGSSVGGESAPEIERGLMLAEGMAA